MQFKNFRDIKLSALGLGAMRLPVTDRNEERIDEALTRDMVERALAGGINYFDTAYGYHGGNSEGVLCRALSKYPRESYFLADKFPGYDLSNMDKVESIFEEQLRRCKTEYFDFYLFHNVYEKNISPYLDKKYGIPEYLLKQKRAGRIRHLGFSSHGRYENLKSFLDALGSEMEFCQIQLNYLDWSFQDARAKVCLLNDSGLPIWVMEPLRGGILASLSEVDSARLKALRPNESTPGWGFRFLQSVPGVTMILSGMSDMAQLEDNITIFDKNSPLDDNERTVLFSIADGMLKKGILPCTACRYCASRCPKKLDIPLLLSLYNEHRFTGGGFLAPMAVDALDEGKRPSDCIGCKSCEAVCPQQLRISEAMADFADML